MEDSAPFRFNFDVGVSGKEGGGQQIEEESEGEGSKSKSGSGGAQQLRQTDEDTVKVEAQAEAAVVMAKEIHPAQENLARSQESLVYAEHKLTSSIALWKVLKLDQSTLVQGLEESTDLVPGRYEGGFKVWECSIDLCQYLVDLYQLDSAVPDGNANEEEDWNHTTCKQLQGKSVLELGCGQGLPGILCLHQGARNVVFQDFNEEVLRSVTHPCVQKNVSSRKEVFDRVDRYVSGDWTTCSDVLGKHEFDLILTAETIYEPKSVAPLLDLLEWCLNPNTGLVLVAAKVYYFGVGGGIAPFEEAVRNQGIFEVKHVFSVDDGASNMREILMLKRKQAKAP